MKKSSIFLVLPIILFLLTGCSNNENTNFDASNTNQTIQANQVNGTDNQNAIAQRVTVPLNNVSSNNIANENSKNNTTDNSTNNTTNTSETELSNFSTNILTYDPNRNSNIRITCDVLNGHIVAPGETFSFTGLVGKSTSDKGYKQANVITSEGTTTKGLGGGNCQVSSTLYNAVVAVPGLEVVERHNHASEVYYVPIGKDAAVAHR